VYTDKVGQKSSLEKNLTLGMRIPVQIVEVFHYTSFGQMRGMREK
jgi:hypothetical protein